MAERSPEAPLAPFGVAIRAAIEESPDFASRAEFCRKMGIEQKTLRRYEIGEKSPKIQDVTRWAEALGVPVSRLITGAPPPESRVERERIEYPSLTEFLSGPEGQTCTPEEVEQLRSVQYSTGDPGTLAYHYLLLSIRAAAKGKAVRQPEATKVEVPEGAMRRRPKTK